MLPLVERRCVSLDLHTVTRIDAAGLAALIKLYCAARDAGHCFSVFNPSPRVAQLLALVRLDSILISNNADESPCHGLQLQESAA
jgi:anti-anti-sigma regulatory factor